MLICIVIGIDKLLNPYYDKSATDQPPTSSPTRRVMWIMGLCLLMAIIHLTY